MSPEDRRQDRARQIAEIRARIGRRQAPAAGPELAEQIQALAGEVSDLKATLAAAYDAAGFSDQEQARPVLRLVQGG